MAIVNMSHFFGVEYYHELILSSTASKEQKDRKAEEAARRNKLIRDTAFLCPQASDPLPGERHFSLWTTYPGLMMGTGYPHDGDIKGDICAGFSFDYVTGLPYLPGSSVKGVLRSAFFEAAYIRELMGDETADVLALERTIFGERLKEDVQIAPDGKVTFMDVYPVKSGDPVGSAGETKKYKLLELDAITPHHSGEHGLLLEPNPLTFLKLRPGVELYFRFLCPNTIDYGDDKHINGAALCNLFKQILLDLGVGAKTNVGFGNLASEGPAVNVRTTAPMNTGRQSPSSDRFNAPRATPQKAGCKTCGKPTGPARYGQPQEYCKECKDKFRKEMQAKNSPKGAN